MLNGQLNLAAKPDFEAVTPRNVPAATLATIHNGCKADNFAEINSWWHSGLFAGQRALAYERVLLDGGFMCVGHLKENRRAVFAALCTQDHFTSFMLIASHLYDHGHVGLFSRTYSLCGERVLTNFGQVPGFHAYLVVRDWHHVRFDDRYKSSDLGMVYARLCAELDTMFDMNEVVSNQAVLEDEYEERDDWKDEDYAETSGEEEGGDYEEDFATEEVAEDADMLDI